MKGYNTYMLRFISIVILFSLTFGFPVFSNPKGKGLWCKNVKSQNSLISLAENKFVEAVGAYFMSEFKVTFYWIEFRSDIYLIKTVEDNNYKPEYATSVGEIKWELRNRYEKYSNVGLSEKNIENPVVKVNRKTLKLTIEGGGNNSEFQCEVAQSEDIFKQMSEEHREELQGFYNQQLEGNKI